MKEILKMEFIVFYFALKIVKLAKVKILALNVKLIILLTMSFYVSLKLGVYKVLF